MNIFLTFSSIFILTIGLSLVRVKSTDVNSCTNVKSPVPLPEVDIKDCSDPPCIFYINSTGIMTMKFRAPRYLEHISPHALATVANVLQQNYTLDQNDACEGITNTPCPLAKGEYVEYTYGMFIDNAYPPIPLNLEFSLVDLDQNDEPFVCFKVDLKLQAQ